MEELDSWNPMEEDFRDRRLNSYREGVGQDLQNRDVSSVEKKSNRAGGGYKPVSLYVRNIPLDVDETVLEHLFLQQGGVLSVKIPEVNQENVMKYKSKIAFVTMENAKGAQAAIEQLDGFRLKDRVLGVNVKLSKEEMQKKKDAQVRNEQFLAMCTSGSASQQSVSRTQNDGGMGRGNMSTAARNAGAPVNPAPGNNDLLVTLQNGTARRVHDIPTAGSGQPATPIGRRETMSSTLASAPGRVLPAPSVIGSDDGLNICAFCRRRASQRCQACKSVYYCSVACQSQHWPTHRRVCVYDKRGPAAPVHKAPLLPEPDFNNLDVDISESFINNNKEYLKEWLMKNDAAHSESSGSSGGNLKHRPVFHSPDKNKPHDQGLRTVQRDPRQQAATNNTPAQPPTNSRPPQPKANSTEAPKPNKQDQGNPEQFGGNAGQARRENRSGYPQQGGNNRSGPQQKRGGGGGYSSGSGYEGKEGGPQQRKGGDQSAGFQKDGRDQRLKDGNTAGQGKKQVGNFQDKGNNKKRGEQAGEKGGDKNRQRAETKQQEGALKSPPQNKASPFVSSSVASSGTCTSADKTSPLPVKAGPKPAAKTSQSAGAPVKSVPAGKASAQGTVAQPTTPLPGSDLELNQQIKVVMCYMDSPQSFWVQEVKQYTDVMSTIAEVMQSYDGTGQAVSSVSVGQNFLCEFLGDLCRCRVEKVSEDSVTIYYIDFGNSEVTQVSKLLPLPAGIAHLPALAIHCSLQVVPSGGDKWPQEVLNQVKELFTDAICYITPLRRAGTILEVALVRTTDDLNASDLLINNSLGVPPSSSAAAVPVVATPTRLMASSLGNTKDTLSVGQRVDLVIVDTSSPMDIFTRISSLEPNFNDLSDKMVADYNTSPDVPYTPVVGELIVCRFSANKSWYRANVLEVAESTGLASVLYIDFGNSETLPFSELRAVKPEYASIPVHGFHAALGGFKPPGGQWDEEHTALYATCLKKYLMEQENDYPRCTVLVESVGSGEGGVVWVDMVMEGLQMTLSEDLSQQLDGSRLPQPLLPLVVTSTESAEPTSPAMPALSPMRPDAVPSTTSATSPKANGDSCSSSSPKTLATSPQKSGSGSSPTRNQTSSVSSPAVPPLASHKESPLIMLKKATLQLDATVVCGIQEIVSCQEFYINLKEAEEKLDTLREELNQFCSRNADEDGPQTLKAVKLNDLVLVEFSADKEWYRGRVDRILDNGKSCQVFFLDYGNMEVKNVAEVKILPPSLRSEPAQAIACKLAGVMPPVSPQVEARFKSACLQTEVKVKARGVEGDTYIVEVITADDRSVTSILDVQSGGRRGVTRGNKPAAVLTSEELPALTPASPVAQDTLSEAESKKQQQCPALTALPKAEDSGVLMRECLQCVELSAELTAGVMHVVTPYHFYIIPVDQYSAQHNAEGLESALLELNTHHTPLDHVPVVGELLCGPFCGQWYRCEVMEVVQPKVRVLFFDYGNEEMLDISDLATLPRVLCDKYPLATFRCSLHGIEPLAGQDTWDEETIQLTKVLLENHSVKVTVRSQHEGVHHVSLSDCSSGEDVGQMLVECNKAVAVDVAESKDGGDNAGIALAEATVAKGVEKAEVDSEQSEIDAAREKEAILREMEALKARLAALK